MPKPLLTKKKAQWAGKFKPNIIRGEKLNYNAAVEERYRRALTSLTKQMTAQTTREIVRLFQSDAAKAFFAQDESVASKARVVTNALISKFSQLFARKAKSLAAAMVNNADKASTTALHGSLKKLSGGLSLKTSFLTGPMNEVVTASIAENVALIKSIPQKYLQDVQGAVMRSITNGNGLADLQPFLEKLEGSSIKRAKLIAEDQTKKVYANLNSARAQKIGVKQFEWVHSGGGAHPRELHESYDGQIFSFDDLPVIDDRTGEKGIPGQLINCRCTMVPVINFDNGGSNDGSAD